MPNRREFLAISLASSALPILAGEQSESTPNLENSNIGLVRSGLVVVEMTSPLALAFRAEALEQELETHGIQDDITDLWYNHLDREWRNEPATLAGITLSTSLFCLETFARDRGMRVWFRAIHNKTERVMSGDECLIEHAANLDGQWPAAFARFAAAVPLEKSGKFQQKIVQTAALPSEEPGPMVSWIIAPHVRNQSSPIS